MLPDILQRKEPKDWTYTDLQLVIGCEESIGLEIKSDLPLKKDASGWRKSKKLHPSEKEGLGKEIVAFANSYGGDLLIGFEESNDNPKRAINFASKINAVDDLIDQLKRSFAASIEPPLVGLQLVAIKENSDDDDGYILIRVPDSLSKPHGMRSPPPSYLRRDDRSEPMGIRDMQDRFFEAQTSRQRIESEIAFFSIPNTISDIKLNSVCASLTLIPKSTVDTHDILAVIQSNDYQKFRPNTDSKTNASLLSTPSASDWKPYAFGIKAHRKIEYTTRPSLANWVIKDNGTINAHGYRMGDPIKDISDGIYDIQVFPFWISCVARELLQLQTSLIRQMEWPAIDWFFICEFQTSHNQTYVNTDPGWSEFEKIDFIKPVTLNPIRVRNAFDSEGVDLIEQKISSLFGINHSIYNKVMSFIPDKEEGSV